MAEGLNAREVLANVEKMIAEAEDYNKGRQWYHAKWRKKIWDVCEELSIFDWWNEYLSVSQLKQMRSFLKTAIRLGYTGHVCFKVGATGCSHGMWAHKKESADGFSPDGGCLFHSFRCGDNYWGLCLDNGKWIDEEIGYKEYSLKEIKEAISIAKLADEKKESA